MPTDRIELSLHETEQIVEGLLGLGWSSEGDVLYSPYRTMWLSRSTPWQGGLLEFRNRMMGRLERIKDNRDDSDSLDTEKSISDTAGLARLLDRMSLPVDGGVGAFFSGIESVLVAFAFDHNLQLNKYNAGQAEWQFLFRSPRGSPCAMTVGRLASGRIRLTRCWVCEPDCGPRSSRKIAVNLLPDLLDATPPEKEFSLRRFYTRRTVIEVVDGISLDPQELRVALEESWRVAVS